MNKQFIFLLLAIFLLGITTAGEVENDLLKQRDCIQLAQSCASCSYINLSYVKYPNQSYVIRGEYPMTKNGTSYNYSFCDTGTLGTYEWCHHGDINGTDTPNCLRFEVTPSGFTGTFGFYVIILIFSIGIILMGFYIEDNWVIMFGSIGLYFVGLYMLFFGIDGMKDVIYTKAFAIIILFVAAYFSIRGAYEALNG